MKQSEDNQDIVGLDMAKGLHGINYPQKFVRAEGVNKPGPRNHQAMLCESLDSIMRMMKK